MNIYIYGLTFLFKFTSSYRYSTSNDGHVLRVCYGFEFNFLSIMIPISITYIFSILFYLQTQVRDAAHDHHQ